MAWQDVPVRVETSGGAGIVGAEVHIDVQNPLWTDYSKTKTTDANGEVNFFNVDAGNGKIKVRAAGYADNHIFITVTSGVFGAHPQEVIVLYTLAEDAADVAPTETFQQRIAEWWEDWGTTIKWVLIALVILAIIYMIVTKGGIGYLKGLGEKAKAQVAKIKAHVPVGGV